MDVVVEVIKAFGPNKKGKEIKMNLNTAKALAKNKLVKLSDEVQAEVDAEEKRLNKLGKDAVSNHNKEQKAIEDAKKKQEAEAKAKLDAEKKANEKADSEAKAEREKEAKERAEKAAIQKAVEAAKK